MMKRREFITLVGGAAAAWPLAARAQQPSMPVIGFLSNGSTDAFASRVAAFRRGLLETGHTIGRDVTVEYRWADGRNDRLPELAADLVRRQVSIIVTTNSTPTALAAKAATTTIPIVFTMGTDPVESGLVASLNRPGGNITGVTGLGVELGPKRLELVRELVPAASVIAVLVNPTSPVAGTHERGLQVAARTLGVELQVLHASTERDFDAVFATLLERRAGALMIAIDPFFTSRSEQLAALTLRHAVPAIYVYREFAAAGGLMSYGASFVESSRLVGIYAGRILKGEKPADLPVQQAAKVELIINLKTAKALGLTVSLPLLGRADEVIE
jgi:putative tryptophan/tyrosine transport system substrate-binding protein